MPTHSRWRKRKDTRLDLTQDLDLIAVPLILKEENVESAYQTALSVVGRENTPPVKKSGDARQMALELP